MRITKLSRFKYRVFKMTFIDWYCLLVDLFVLGSLIFFTFYFGVEVGKLVGA